jgi:hypothetical protein
MVSTTLSWETVNVNSKPNVMRFSHRYWGLSICAPNKQKSTFSPTASPTCQHGSDLLAVPLPIVVAPIDAIPSLVDFVTLLPTPTLYRYTDH